jgi:hypothetical protein
VNTGVSVAPLIPPTEDNVANFCIAFSPSCYHADGHVFIRVTVGTTVGSDSDTNISLAWVGCCVRCNIVHCNIVWVKLGVCVWSYRLFSPNSVVVNDNAPFNNVLFEWTPSSNSRTVDMINRLSSHGIAYYDEIHKPQLYSVIQIDKPRAQKYLVDHILFSYGITVLHLPHHHSALSPIEMIRSQIKQWVASRNDTFKTENVKLS